MWCVSKVPRHSGFTPWVSTEPFPVCVYSVRPSRCAMKEELWELLIADDMGVLE